MSISKTLFKYKKLKFFVKKIIGKFNFERKISLRGKKFIVPILNNIGYKNLVSEDGDWLYVILKRFFNKYDYAFIDVGTNIGQTLLQLKSLGNNIRYVGIEPNPTCISYVRQLIKVNRFENVQIVPAGLYSENKLLNLYLEGTVDSGATIIEDLRPGVETENLIVPVFNFKSVKDDLEIEEIGIIKIDVEGAELEVLKGIIPYLNGIKPVFICEILWAHNNDRLDFMKKRNEEIYDLLSGNHFEIYQILKSDNLNNIIEFKKINKFESMVYTLENRNLCDYIFIHEEKNHILKELLN